MVNHLACHKNISQCGEFLDGDVVSSDLRLIDCPECMDSSRYDRLRRSLNDKDRRRMEGYKKGFSW